MLRLMILILMLVTAPIIAGAQKSADEILQEKPNDSWKTGVWDKNRMAPFDSTYLLFIGQDFLRGRNVAQDISKAEALFEGAVRKDKSQAVYVGLGYLNYTKNKEKAFEWFSRGLISGDIDAKNWLGLLMRNIGTEILRQKILADPPSSEALAWLLAASKYGNIKATSKISTLKLQITKDQLKLINSRSLEIIGDPLNSYRLIKGLKIAPIAP
jgi:hypothetical protein